MTKIASCIINSYENIKNFMKDSLIHPVKESKIYKLGHSTINNTLNFLYKITLKTRNIVIIKQSCDFAIKVASKVKSAAFGSGRVEDNPSQEPHQLSSSNEMQDLTPKTLEEILQDKYAQIRNQKLSDQELGPALAQAYAEVHHPLPPSRFSRDYPNVECGDTVCFRPQNRDLLTSSEYESLSLYLFNQLPCRYKTRIIGNHGLALSYKDQSIVQEYPLFKEKGEESSFYRGRTQQGAYVSIQKGVRGCVAACASMILSDYLQRYIEPAFMNLGTDENIKQTIKNHGLTPKETHVENLNDLSNALKNGPACVGVTTVGGHEIVVDSVEEDGVNIRDPYHGWAIKITTEAFLKSSRLDKNTISILQVSSN